MADENGDKGTESEIAAKAAAAQGVGNDDKNDSNDGPGNAQPPAPSNEPPTPAEPTDDEKAEAEKKATADKEAEDKAAAEAAADKDNTPLDEDVWGSTGNDVADSVLTMLQNADVSPDEAKALLFDAVKEGDLTKIDVKALEAKVGKTKATLIMAGVTTFVADQNKRNTEIVADIKVAAGGEDNWKKITDWGNKTLSDDQLMEYRGMIDKGGAMARFAVSEMAGKYNADEANTSITTGSTTPALEGDAGKGAGARSTSRAEYVAELTKAHKVGASDAVLDEITQARRRGRTEGKT